MVYLLFQGFIARTRRIYNIELQIARKRDKLNNHFRKWEKLISIFTNERCPISIISFRVMS